MNQPETQFKGSSLKQKIKRIEMNQVQGLYFKQVEEQMNFLINGIINGVVQGKREIYNPVYFYGDPVRVRLSLDRLVRAYTRAHPEDFIYRTNGVDFVCKLLYAVKEGTTENFEGLFRNVRLLVFESVEVIAGREFSMHHFYSIFDAVYERGGIIVLGGIRPPSQIATLEDRVRTQMEGGIICNLNEK